jgi:exopolysaccharide biosynthesis predicted pyruvyltransferase EpsI
MPGRADQAMQDLQRAAHPGDRLRIQLNARIEQALLPRINRATAHICIIDPPGHTNVGDNAILLGELAFLRRHFPAARLSYYDVHNYTQRADRLIDQADVLLIHGGGNFGDIWPSHHELRLLVLKRFRNKPILQLPQSIHFDDNRQLAETAAAIQRHPRFCLAVRDEPSLAFGRRHFDCELVLSPDMAFAMPPIARRPAELDYFCLLRTDKEAVTSRQAIVDAVSATGRSFAADDWLGETTNLVTELDRAMARLTRRSPATAALFGASAMWLRQLYAQRRLAYGTRLLSRGSAVVTDRLHAHILCCLMDIPHFFFDSYDGKIAAFHRSWTQAFSAGKLVASPDALSFELAQQP